MVSTCSLFWRTSRQRKQARRSFRAAFSRRTTFSVVTHGLRLHSSWLRLALLTYLALSTPLYPLINSSSLIPPQTPYATLPPRTSSCLEARSSIHFPNHHHNDQSATSKAHSFLPSSSTTIDDSLAAFEKETLIDHSNTTPSDLVKW